MKKLLFFCIFFSFARLSAQVVFCPSGAEWNYNFTYLGYYDITKYIENEKIKYSGDTLIGSDTCKILKHKRYFLTGNTSFNTKLTFIKQKSDSILYKNPTTQNTWQLLYNFAAQPGDKWVNFYVNPSYLVITNTVTVKSTSTLSINGITLKQLVLNVSFKQGSNTATNVTDTITERFGSSKFLFANYIFYKNILIDQLDRFLCYSDNAFGTKKFSSLPCDFSNPTSIANSESIENTITVFPNPVISKLVLNTNDRKWSKESELVIISPLGKKIFLENRVSKEDHFLEVDLSHCENGIYFLQLFEKGKLILTKKIIKE